MTKKDTFLYFFDKKGHALTKKDTLLEPRPISGKRDDITLNV